MAASQPVGGSDYRSVQTPFTHKWTIKYAVMALLTFMLIVKDYVVLDQGIEDDKNKTGQCMMISLSSMNFIFYLILGVGLSVSNGQKVYGATIDSLNGPINYFFALTTVTYIVLWYLQSSWVKDGVKWGKDMTGLGKANFYMTWLFTLPYIYIIYHAFAGKITTTKAKGIFGLIVVVLLALPFLIIKLNK